MKDSNGKNLDDGPNYILAHELVGHAIPWSVKPDSGNAVKNENKIRIETNSNLRIEDKTHYE